MRTCNRRIYDTLCGRKKRCRYRIDFKDLITIGAERVYGYCDDPDIHYATQNGVKL